MELKSLLPNKTYKMKSERKQHDCPRCEGKGYVEEVTQELYEADPAVTE
jgi:hypothetical protein